MTVSHSQPETGRYKANVKIRRRGEQFQVVEETTRRILFRAYYEDQADAWCAEYGHYIVERP